MFVIVDMKQENMFVIVDMKLKSQRKQNFDALKCSVILLVNGAL